MTLYDLQTRKYFTVIQGTEKRAEIEIKARTSQQLSLLSEAALGCAALSVMLRGAGEQRSPDDVCFGSRQGGMV